MKKHSKAKTKVAGELNNVITLKPARRSFFVSSANYNYSSLQFVEIRKCCSRTTIISLISSELRTKRLIDWFLLYRRVQQMRKMACAEWWAQLATDRYQQLANKRSRTPIAKENICHATSGTLSARRRPTVLWYIHFFIYYIYSCNHVFLTNMINNIRVIYES